MLEVGPSVQCEIEVMKGETLTFSSFREKVFSLFILISVAVWSVILFILLQILLVIFSFSMSFSWFPLHQFSLWYQYTAIILSKCFDDLEGIYKIPLDSSLDVFLLACHYAAN